MDAYRKDNSFLIRLDLPCVCADAVELTVKENVLTIKAERGAPTTSNGIEVVIAERFFGTITRQVFLGTNLDTQHVWAEYEAGVLTFAIPVVERAEPCRIESTERGDHQQLATT